VDNPLVEFNLPVGIDSVVIRPADIVVADENGVSIVPAELATEVLDGVRRLLATEAKIRDKINSGMSLEQLLAEFGNL
jgi:4-hydroxy-4-methyl-2-oxoglutarate aldolase